MKLLCHVKMESFFFYSPVFSIHHVFFVMQNMRLFPLPSIYHLTRTLTLGRGAGQALLPPWLVPMLKWAYRDGHENNEKVAVLLMFWTQMSLVLVNGGHAFLGGKDWMGCIYLGFEGTLLKVLGNFRRKKRELFFFAKWTLRVTSKYT